MKMEAPRATAGQLMRALERGSEISDTPEARLVLAVLRQALQDAMKEGYRLAQREAESARRFWLEGRHAYWCDLIGLDPDYVGRLVRDHAGLQ